MIIAAQKKLKNVPFKSFLTNTLLFCSDMMDDLLSEPEGSYSSRMSNKSEKNLADYEGEESNCDEELAQLAVRAHHVSYFFSLTSYI